METFALAHAYASRSTVSEIGCRAASSVSLSLQPPIRRQEIVLCVSCLSLSGQSTIAKNRHRYSGASACCSAGTVDLRREAKAPLLQPCDCSHARAHARPSSPSLGSGPFPDTPHIPLFTPAIPIQPHRHALPTLVAIHLCVHFRCPVATRLPPHAPRQLLALTRTSQSTRLPRHCLAA